MMATTELSFPSLSTGIRDLTDKKGLRIELTNGTTDSYPSIGGTATLKLGLYSTIVLNGNVGYNHNYGVIEATDFTYIIDVTGRADFGTSRCGYKVHNMSFVYLGNGSIFTHLEDDENRTVFTGDLKFTFDMTGGRGLVQFFSKEYSNVTITARPTNVGSLVLYMARVSAGFTHLTKLKTVGLQEITFTLGNSTTSRGRVIDPTYEGVTDNLIKIIPSGAGSWKYIEEYFSIDVTDIMSNNGRIKVTDSSGATHYDNYELTEDNTTYQAQDGADLTAYANRNVVLCRVRLIRVTSTTRNLINYEIRSVKEIAIKVDNFAMNNPVVIKEMANDEHYDITIPEDSVTGVAFAGTTVTITESRTVQEVYNYLKERYVKDFNISKFFSFNNAKLDFSSYNVVVDGVGVVLTGDILTTGNVTLSNGGSINGLYPFPNDQVGIKCIINNTIGIRDRVFGVWPKSQGVNDRTGIKTAKSGEIVAVDKNIDYYVVADAVNAIRSDVVTVNSRDFGITVRFELERVKKADGTNLLPDALTTEQDALSTMMQASSLDGKVHITVPVDFATNSRFDSVSDQFIFTRDDCIVFQYKAEVLQSSQASLRDPTTLGIYLNETVVAPTSSFTLIQGPENATRGFTGTINLSAFCIRREGDDKFLNTFVDNSNGVIQVNGKPPIAVTVSTPSDILNQVVNEIPAKVDDSTLVKNIVDTNTNIDSVLEEITKIDGTKYIRLKADALEEQDVIVNTAGGLVIDEDAIATSVWNYGGRSVTANVIEDVLIKHSYTLGANVASGVIQIPLDKVVADDEYNGHIVIVGTAPYNRLIKDTVTDTTTNISSIILDKPINAVQSGEPITILNKQNTGVLKKIKEIKDDEVKVSNFESL